MSDTPLPHSAPDADEPIAPPEPLVTAVVVNDAAADSSDVAAGPETVAAADSTAEADDCAPEGASKAASVPAASVATLNPAEVAQRLKQLFPALFGGAPKPLKLRVQVDIQERAPGTFSKQALSAFFRRHTGSTSYLIAVSRAANRFDLDGQPAGELSAEHRQVALDELARRRGNQESRRELEDQQRRNRAGLLHDFQATTLTKANFCALKGVPVDELDGLLEIARGEAEERSRQALDARHAPARHDARPSERPAPRGDRPPRRPEQGARDGARPPRRPR
jgi:ProP effector